MSVNDMNKVLKDFSILLVEDDVLVARTLEIAFTKFFKEIFVVNDGFKALEVIEKENINVVLCDFRMPRKNGIELLKDLRSQNYNASYFLISATTLDSQSIEQLEKLSVAGILRKPATVQNIMNMICLVLAEDVNSK